MNTTPTDPAAIDLVADLRKWADTFNDVSCAPRLREASNEIEALRERVAETEIQLSMHSKWLGEALSRAEAAEAHVAALAGALEDMFSDWRYIRQQYGDLPGVGWDRAENKACAVLAATPEDVMERAKAVRAQSYAAGLEAAAKWHDRLVTFMEDGPHEDATQAAAKLHQKCAKAIRALGKE